MNGRGYRVYKKRYDNKDDQLLPDDEFGNFVNDEIEQKMRLNKVGKRIYEKEMEEKLRQIQNDQSVVRQFEREMLKEHF